MLIGEGRGRKGVRGQSGDLGYVDTIHGGKGAKDLLHMTGQSLSSLGKKGLQCLRDRSRQVILLLLESAGPFIGCGAHKGNRRQFT